jgi:DNA-binding response OmpR family regulator
LPDNASVLVVEDEAKITDVLRIYLENAGFKVFAAFDGEAGLALFRETNPSLVVLDLALPKLSGEKVCEEIRAVSGVPIIMLTAKGAEDEKIAGFALGADDYVTKPFSPRELVARVRGVLRRAAGGVAPGPAVMRWNGGDLEIDAASRVVKKRGEDARLTPNEFKILTRLAGHPGRAFTRDELIESALGNDFDGFGRTIDSHVKNLRSKIEDDSSNPVYVVTVRGVGYKFGA